MPEIVCEIVHSHRSVDLRNPHKYPVLVNGELVEKARLGVADRLVVGSAGTFALRLGQPGGLPPPDRALVLEEALKDEDQDQASARAGHYIVC